MNAFSLTLSSLLAFDILHKEFKANKFFYDIYEGIPKGKKANYYNLAPFYILSNNELFVLEIRDLIYLKLKTNLLMK